MRYVLANLGVVFVVGCGGTGATILDDGGAGDSGQAQDVTVSDAVSDVETDASDASDGSTCTSAPTCPVNAQCTTFDNASPFPPFSSSAKGSGTVAATSTTSVSCPSSLLSTLPIVAASSGARATISSGAATKTQPAHVVLELDVQLPAQTSPVSFFSVFPDSGGAVGLSVDNTGTWMLFVRGASSTALTPQPKVGVWTHMKLEVTFAIAGQASLTVDGNKTTFTGNTNSTNGNLGAVGVEVGIDPADGATTTAMSAYYDNVAYSPP